LSMTSFPATKTPVTSTQYRDRSHGLSAATLYLSGWFSCCLPCSQLRSTSRGRPACDALLGSGTGAGRPLPRAVLSSDPQLIPQPILEQLPERYRTRVPVCPPVCRRQKRPPHQDIAATAHRLKQPRPFIFLVGFLLSSLFSLTLDQPAAGAEAHWC